jgi:hypothetical protein
MMPSQPTIVIIKVTINIIIIIMIISIVISIINLFRRTASTNSEIV